MLSLIQLLHLSTYLPLTKKSVKFLFRLKEIIGGLDVFFLISNILCRFNLRKDLLTVISNWLGMQKFRALESRDIQASLKGISDKYMTLVVSLTLIVKLRDAVFSTFSRRPASSSYHSPFGVVFFFFFLPPWRVH